MVKRIAGHGLIDLNGPSVDLKDIEIDVESLKGTGWFKLQQAAVPDIQFALAFDTLNVDDFVDDSASKTKESDNQSSEPTNPDAEPDLTVLNSFNVDGDLTFSKVLAAGLTVSNVKLHANLKNGKLVANPLHADLYQGTLDSKVTLNAQAPVSSYTVGVNLKGVEAQPMLTDLAEFEMLSGNANFEMTVRGKGLSTNKLKAGSAGAGKFWFADGAVHGVNVAQMIRSAKSMLKGESGESEVKKTDFSELSGSFTLAKGLVTNPDLKLSSPLLRVDGKGTFDVIKSYIDYAATTELVATSKGQGGKEANDLAGIKIPLKISGTPDDLKYGLDMEAALKGDLEEKLEKEKEKGIEKLSEKLGGFLGGL
nr:AsmA family protein [Echinimonas agarilytica]